MKLPAIGFHDAHTKSNISFPVPEASVTVEHKSISPALNLKHSSHIPGMERRYGRDRLL